MDNIIIKKIWEDSEFFEVNIGFSSDNLTTNIDVYVTNDIINNISKTMILFLEEKNSCYFEIVEKNDDYPYIRINFDKIDSHGNAVLNVYIEYNSEDFDNRFYCFFPMYIEHGLLYSFGKRIKKLNEMSVGEKVSIL